MHNYIIFAVKKSEDWRKLDQDYMCQCAKARGIADLVWKVFSDDETEAMEYAVHEMGAAMQWDFERKEFTVSDVDSYFRPHFEEFQTALADLSKLDYEQYTSKMIGPTLKVRNLEWLFDNDGTMYFVDPANNFQSPLQFLRHCIPGESYVFEMFKYHN